MKVAVIGATGFVGRQLIPALVDRGHDVLALTRDPERYRGPGNPRFADLADQESLARALQGADVAYLLAHSLGSDSFREREAAHGMALRDAADRAGLGQIVFLSGLGQDEDDLSEHLRSRHEVEAVLRAGSVPVTVLRAGIIIGPGSTGWEMLRQLVEAMPVIVCDGRANTRSQPVAACDAIGYLVDALGRTDLYGQVLEIGGPEVLTYADMAERFARLTKRKRLRVWVPWLPHRVAAAGVELLTTVGGRQAQDLLGSLGNEAIVIDASAQRLLPRATLGFDEAVGRALRASQPRSRWATLQSAGAAVCSGRLVGWPWQWRDAK